MTKEQKYEAIHNLRIAADEIRFLRDQVRVLKAQVEIVNKMTGYYEHKEGSGSVSPDIAWALDNLKDKLMQEANEEATS